MSQIIVKSDVSVRELVEFILRSGNIERGSGAFDAQAMQEGSRIHKKLQGANRADYRAEVTLSHTTDIVIEDACHRVSVSGRADGVFAKDGMTYIDEIKSMKGDVRLLAEPIGIHLSQAMCYAFFLLEQRESQEPIGVQMTYVTLPAEIIRYFDRIFTY
jgi:Mg-chelatase subunit ChlI